MNKEDPRAFENIDFEPAAKEIADVIDQGILKNVSEQANEEPEYEIDLEKFLHESEWTDILLFYTESEERKLEAIKHSVFFFETPSVLELAAIINEVIYDDKHKNEWAIFDDRHRWQWNVFPKSDAVINLLSIPGLQYKPVKP